MLRNLHRLTCEECRRPFGGRKKTLRFCSRNCAAVARHRTLGHTPDATITCLVCGNVVVVGTWGVGKIKYCSRACYNVGRRKFSTTFVCATCKLEGPRKVRGRRAQFCSVKRS